MQLLPHQKGSFLSPWSCPTVSARLPTCVSLRRNQKWRLSGLYPFTLYASLGAERRTRVTYTHVVSRLLPERHRLRNDRVAVGLLVPSWRVTADWAQRCNQPCLLKPCSLHDVESGAMTGYPHGKSIYLWPSDGVGLVVMFHNFLWSLAE
jgi:hypothetical protein